MNYDGIEQAIRVFVEAHREWAIPIVALLAFGESIAFVSLVLPFWGILVAIGAIIGTSNLPVFIGLWLAASIGAALGDWLSYWLGFHYHDRIWKIWPLSRYPDMKRRAQAFFARWGVWAIVLGRFSGPFRATIPIVAGTAQMPWLKFQIANWGSAFVWAFVLLVFGDVVGRAFQFVSALFS
jgi:membrane protein DedA with SNARE-associated domain